MVTATHAYQRLFGEHHFHSLFQHLALRDRQDRRLFEQLWRQCHRHAPFFGLRPAGLDAPDVPAELLSSLASSARRQHRHVVKQHVICQLLTLLHKAPHRKTRWELPSSCEAVIAEGQALLSELLGFSFPSIAPAFSRSATLRRHYGARPGALRELLGWTTKALQNAHRHRDNANQATQTSTFGRALHGFLDTMARASTPHAERPLQEPAEGAFLFENADLTWIDTQEESEGFVVEGLWYAIPAEATSNPLLMAATADTSISTPQAPENAPQTDLSSYPAHRDDVDKIADHWLQMLQAEVDAAGLLHLDTYATQSPKTFGPLAETALLVHLLGLEAREGHAVMATAADRFLTQIMAPRAAVVRQGSQRHEPLATLLVSILAKALRPWKFDAPALRVEQRIVLMFALAESGTGKARKLLHEEKKHANKHPDPSAIRNGANLALKRWAIRRDALNPTLRIEQLAAVFRYMNRVRRHLTPSLRDLHTVADMVAPPSGL